MNTKKLSAAIAIVIGLSSTGAYADRQEITQGVRSSSSFIGGIAIGAAAGGPIGMFIGGISGALLGEKFNEDDARKNALEQSYMDLSLMTEEINSQELEIAHLEKMIEEKMQFQMYFETGKDELTAEDEQQLEALAEFLLENEYMHVSVDGHTDPRGTDPYNQILSEHRAHSVAEVLVSNGIDASRISTKGFGADFSKGINGDMSTYILERKVKVQVFSSKDGAGLASLK